MIAVCHIYTYAVPVSNLFSGFAGDRNNAMWLRRSWLCSARLQTGKLESSICPDRV